MYKNRDIKMDKTTGLFPGGWIRIGIISLNFVIRRGLPQIQAAKKKELF